MRRALVVAALLLAGCASGGGDEVDEAASDDGPATFDEGTAAAQLIGNTVGTMAPSTTTTTAPLPTTTTAPPPTMPAAEAADVEAMCNEVLDYIMDVGNLEPPQPPEVEDEIMQREISIMTRLMSLMAEVSDAGYDRLEECREGFLDHAYG
jgi:hypothetical protein